MFNFFKKDFDIYSPIIGRVVTLEKVSDKAFSEKLLGDGVVFEFELDVIYSPCNGKIIMIAPTKHALGIELPSHAEFLIHIGLDTVNLCGEGFTLLVNEGDSIRRGQALVKINQHFFKKSKVKLITQMIITSADFKVEKVIADSVDLDTIVMKIY